MKDELILLHSTLGYTVNPCSLFLDNHLRPPNTWSLINLSTQSPLTLTANGSLKKGESWKIKGRCECLVLFFGAAGSTSLDFRVRFPWSLNKDIWTEECGSGTLWRTGSREWKRGAPDKTWDCVRAAWYKLLPRTSLVSMALGIIKHLSKWGELHVPLFLSGFLKILFMYSYYL